MQQNKTHFFCPYTLSGAECPDPKCTKQHIQSATINLSELLRITDYFERSKIDENYKDIFKTRHIIDPSKLPAKPILCCVCYHLINPENSVHFPCCNSFCCKECLNNWKWPENCPKCGRKGTAQELNKETLSEISFANDSFKIFEFRPEKLGSSSQNNQ